MDMMVNTAARVPETGKAAILARARAVAAAVQPQLAGIEPDRLVSLVVALPPAVGEVACAGDTHWRAPGGELLLDALGSAAEFSAADAADRFRAAQSRWCCLGDTPAAPLAFFSLPPATAAPMPRLRVPRALLRRTADGTQIVLSAQRGTEAPAALTEAWLGVLAVFLAPPGAAPGQSRILACAADPAAQDWCGRVGRTRDAIAAGRFAKAVLARRLRVSLSHRADIPALTRRLAAMHPDCHVIALPEGNARVVAATPERLAVKQGGAIVCHALAGTARRHGSATDDARAAAALLASPKERREHALVVDAIAARMVGFCAAVAPAPAPAVLALRHVQHLRTMLAGQLRPGVDILAAALSLHPTPAVLGLPAAAAAAWLAELGESRDGLYTGVAGWIDRAGDGDAVVVLRSARIEDDAAVLWAGAGIMADSDPAAELAETDLKLATMLEVLGTAL
jgi:menaquinone-specific isochorismate synthase